MKSTKTCRHRPGWLAYAFCASPLIGGALYQVRTYYLQELLVVELASLIACGFVVALGVVCYLLGLAGEYGGLWIREGTKVRTKRPSLHRYGALNGSQGYLRLARHDRGAATGYSRSEAPR